MFHKNSLFKTSDILIILLDIASNLRKNNKFISYPTKLNLKDYNKNYGTNKPNVYALNGFCIHGDLVEDIIMLYQEIV